MHLNFLGYFCVFGLIYFMNSKSTLLFGRDTPPGCIAYLHFKSMIIHLFRSENLTGALE